MLVRECPGSCSGRQQRTSAARLVETLVILWGMGWNAKSSGEPEWSGGISAMNQNCPLAASLAVCGEVQACIGHILHRTLLLCSLMEFLWIPLSKFKQSPGPQPGQMTLRSSKPFTQMDKAKLLSALRWVEAAFLLFPHHASLVRLPPASSAEWS